MRVLLYVFDLRMKLSESLVEARSVEAKYRVFGGLLLRRHPSTSRARAWRLFAARTIRLLAEAREAVLGDSPAMRRLSAFSDPTCICIVSSKMAEAQREARAAYSRGVVTFVAALDNKLKKA